MLCHLGVFSEECSYGVFGKRETFFVPAGGSLSLFCVVQHCGGNWTGNWKRQNLTTSTTVENNARHRFTIGPVSANQSKLHLKILSVRESDEGFYTCNVKWSDGSHDVSHLMQVNVTKGIYSFTCANQTWIMHILVISVCALLFFSVIPNMQVLPLRENPYTGFWSALAPFFVFLSFWDWLAA